MGGGSAKLVPHHRTTPLAALRRRLGDTVSIVHEPGCRIDRAIPPLAIPMDEVILVDGAEVLRGTRQGTNLVFFGPPVPGLEGAWSVRAQGVFVPEADGPHEIALSQAGRTRVFVDGELVLDGVDDPLPPGSGLLGLSEQRVVVVELAVGRAVEVTIELSNEGAQLLVGATIGVRAVTPADAFDRAVAAAAGADAVVLVVGTNGEWESEASDRTALDLPGDQDELIRRVCAVNRRTVVVVNAGSPVALPWADETAALLDVWFGGQEMADALVDVLTGAAEPGGRLATTFPERIEHSAAFGNFPGEHGEVRYGESLLMGYRWHDARHLPPRFAFGHGLSYTTFELGRPEVEGDEPLVVRVPVTNTGPRAGSEVVQLYVEPVAPSVQRPPKELKAFAKVWLEPGESTVVDLELDHRSFAYWRPDGAAYAEVRARVSIPMPGQRRGRPEGEAAGWHVDPGAYRLHVGRSSVDIAHVLDIQRS